MKLVRILLAILLVAAVVHADVGGPTPATASRIVSGREVTGMVRTSLYFDIVCDNDADLEIELLPVTGEVDLAVVHFSGSPAIESRREGNAPERIILKVMKGDRFLIRVISPFAKPAEFKLKATLASGAAPRIPLEEQVFKPAAAAAATGLTGADAVPLPIGRIAAIEARGTRYFRFAVPRGFVLDVTLFPISGNSDLEANLVVGSSVITASSSRDGFLNEEIYLPAADQGQAIVKVISASSEEGVLRYGLAARLRRVGITSTARNEEPDYRRVLSEIFAGRTNNMGVPGWANSRNTASNDLMQSAILHLH